MKRKKLKRKIADLRKENQELKRSVLREKEANQMKSVFLSHISHDIRTPINGIDGMTNIAIRHFDDKDRVLDCLNKIDSSSQYLLSLLNDVLDINRIESGKMIISYEPMDIRSLINNCADIVDSLLIEKNVEFVKSFGMFRHPVLLGDELHLRRILINILSNAAKFTPDGGEIFFHVREISADSGKAVRTREQLDKNLPSDWKGQINIRCWMDQEGYHWFRIEDNGIGMKPEFLERIWESFSQENSRNYSGFKGSGLGMAITKKLVDLMNGNIYVESEQGVGSKFRVEIAFDVGVMPDFLEIQKKKEERHKQEICLKGKKVLLVEDQPLNMEITKSVLDDVGMDVVTAENGQVAVNIFNNCADGTYDAIIMDVRMPVMDGLSAAKKIRTLPKNDAPTIPIIAMTADTFEEDIKRTEEAGMNAHLSKPINLEEVIRTLNRCLS